MLQLICVTFGMLIGVLIGYARLFGIMNRFIIDAFEVNSEEADDILSKLLKKYK